MNFIKNRSISFKIIAISTVLAGIFLSSSFLYVIKKMESNLLDASLHTLEIETVAEKTRIELVVNEIRNTVLSLKGTPPLQGIIRARANGGVDVLGNSTTMQWRERLQRIFISEIEATGLYDQLRYIDASGEELVRVDFVDGAVQLISDENLQNKKDRDYFIEAQKLEEGEVYISLAELNKEGNPPRISIPHRPVIRYATPVFNDVTGEREGMVIANVLVDAIITRGKVEWESQNTGTQLYITDSAGFFISHPDEKKQWGSRRDLDSGISLTTEFSGITEDTFIEESGSSLQPEGFFAYATVSPDDSDQSREWVILEVTPENVIFGPINSIVISALLVGIGAFVLLFFVFLFLIKRLFKPLEDLAEGAERLGKGDFSSLVTVYATDEIGKVAGAFNSMMAKLKELYDSLEQKVLEKTKDLDAKVVELEKTQLAITNVLEDIGAEKEKIETILESIGDGVFVIDSNLNILIFNDISAELSGYSPAEAIGKPYTEILHFVYEVDGTQNDTFIKDAILTGKVQSMEKDTNLISKNGKVIPVADSAAPLKDSTGNIVGVVVVFRDISKEREVDRAKTEFVSLASHQLRTPLSAINWYAEMLLSGDAGELNPEQKDFVDELYSGSKRMAGLVDALLNVSRIEMGTFMVEPISVDLQKLSEVALNELKPMVMKKNISITTEYDSELVPYMGDEKLLLIIFQNLLSNAVKYTPEGGHVALGIVQNTNKNKIFITVKDTGYGIPSAQKDKIFTKLFRADNVKAMDSTGTGLGLYIIKAIVERSEGEISFESEEGKGTTFSITLPLSGMKKKDGSKPLE